LLEGLYSSQSFKAVFEAEKSGRVIQDAHNCGCATQIMLERLWPGLKAIELGGAEAVLIPYKLSLQFD
jgi:hypothetical protein